MPSVYLIAGEASGDALGAGLMQGLKSLSPATTFAGIGGDAMQHEGMQSLFPYQELAVMGFWEIVPHIPKFLRLLRETVEDIAHKKPDVIVTIDSPGFTFRLAKMLKKDPRTQHIKRVHYVAPSVWAYKSQRARKAAELFELLFAILPFEPPYFEKEGLKTVFVGHPVLMQPKKGDAMAFRRLHGIAADEKILLVLPGSRMGEVRRHLPIFLAAATQLAGVKIAVLAAPQVRDAIKNVVPPEVILCDFAEKHDAFAAAAMALSKSGTVTLELAAAGVATVVAHKVSALSAWLIRRMLLIQYASLVNIAVNKEIVPELMQEKCNAAAITDALKNLMQPEAMQKQSENIKGAISALRGNNRETPGIMGAKAILSIINEPLSGDIAVNS